MGTLSFSGDISCPTHNLQVWKSLRVLSILWLWLFLCWKPELSDLISIRVFYLVVFLGFAVNLSLPDWLLARFSAVVVRVVVVPPPNNFHSKIQRKTQTGAPGTPIRSWAPCGALETWTWLYHSADFAICISGLQKWSISFFRKKYHQLFKMKSNFGWINPLIDNFF